MGVNSGNAWIGGAGDISARLALARMLATFDDTAQSSNPGGGQRVAVGRVELSEWLAAHAAEYDDLEDLLEVAGLPQPEPLIDMRTTLAYGAVASWQLLAARVDQRGLLLHVPDRDDPAPAALLATWEPWHDDAALSTALTLAWSTHFDDVFFGQQTTAHGRATPAMLQTALFEALETQPEFWAAVRDYAFPLDTRGQRRRVLCHLLHNAA